MELKTSPKKLSRRFCGPRLSGWVATVRTAWFAHFGGPGTILNLPIRHKFGLELMTSPKKLLRRFCGPRLSGCVATVKNCLKQACFAHFGWPGTIPNKPIRHTFGLELMMSPKKSSRTFCGPRLSG